MSDDERCAHGRGIDERCASCEREVARTDLEDAAVRAVAAGLAPEEVEAAVNEALKAAYGG